MSLTIINLEGKNDQDTTAEWKYVITTTLIYGRMKLQIKHCDATFSSIRRVVNTKQFPSMFTILHETIYNEPCILSMFWTSGADD
jgi:hypothetical protein